MKKKKKKKNIVYCSDGPCQGIEIKIPAEDREFGIITPRNPFFEVACYKIVSQIGFVSKLIGVHTHNMKRKRK